MATAVKHDETDRTKMTTQDSINFSLPSDYSTIQFDSRLVSAEDIKNTIEEIAQGIYSVVNIQEFKMNK